MSQLAPRFPLRCRPTLVAAFLVAFLPKGPTQGQVSTPPAPTGGTAKILAISIEPSTEASAYQIRPLHLGRLDGTPATMATDPDQDPSGQRLRLHCGGAACSRLVVEARLRTSLVLANDGKHRDMVDWLHGATPWQTLPPATDGTFALPDKPEEMPPFPDYSTIAPPEHWRADFADPFWSKVESWTHLDLRISLPDGDTSRVLQEITILLPTGC